MLFYSYAELVVGLIAVFFFTSKVFSIIKYKMYFALSLIFIILTRLPLLKSTPYLMSMILYSEDLPRKNDEFLQNNTLGEGL